MSKTQVIVIHGGTTFADYDAYLKHLQTKSLFIDRFVYTPKWKELLQERLGEAYQVLLPPMPNGTNARYSEWKIWFDHFSELITDDCILIGHSMGAIFLAKYLSETKFPVTIKATFFIASPFSDESMEDLTDFKIESLSDMLEEQAGTIVFFNGDDDPVISKSDVDQYRKVLTSAEFITLPAPDHFVRQDFPELIEKIHAIQATL